MVRLTGVPCTVGDGELILASNPTRGSRHDFPPVGPEGHCFFSYFIRSKNVVLKTTVCDLSSIIIKRLLSTAQLRLIMIVDDLRVGKIQVDW